MTDGRMANAQLTNYIIPTPLDAPPIDVGMLERPYRHGPFGAKGVGEMPIDGPAPAVVNALRHCGFDIRAIPATSGAADRRPRRTMNLTINGKRRRLDVHADDAAARCAARGLRADRHQGRLRRRRVRRVHRADRRRRRRLVHRAGRAGRGLPGVDDRRRRRGEASGQGAAERVRGARRRAVRHLHAGHDPGGDCR